MSNINLDLNEPYFTRIQFSSQNFPYFLFGKGYSPPVDFFKLDFIDLFYFDGTEVIREKGVIKAKDHKTGFNSLDMTIDPQNGLHIIWGEWKKKTTYDYMAENPDKGALYYRYKPPNGNWREPIIIVSEQTPISYFKQIISDKLGNIFLIYKSKNNLFLKIKREGKWLESVLIPEATNIKEASINLSQNGNLLIYWKMETAQGLIFTEYAIEGGNLKF